MRAFAIVLCLLATASACSSNSARLPAAASSATDAALTSSTATAPASAITVGKEVVGTLQGHGSEHVYELTAASTGTLVARLSWAPTEGRLELNLLDKQFANFPDNRSPIVGKVPVSAGLTYRIRVADGAPWDYDGLSLSYVLATVIE